MVIVAAVPEMAMEECTTALATSNNHHFSYFLFFMYGYMQQNRLLFSSFLVTVKIMEIPGLDKIVPKVVVFRSGIKIRSKFHVSNATVLKCRFTNEKYFGVCVFGQNHTSSVS